MTAPDHPETRAGDSDRLRSLLDVVEHSLDDPRLGAADLAARAYLSRFHFDRLVSATLGEPPGAMRRRLFLERAAHQLLTGPQSVTRVGLAAGYGSTEAFSRAFTRAFAVSPSTFRTAGGTAFRLGADDVVHFHPPGGLRLPSIDRRPDVDVLAGMLDHHLQLTDRILERVGRLDDDVLDRPLITVEGIDAPQTLRSTSARLVTQLEMWIVAVRGGTQAPGAGDAGILELRRRLAVAGPLFRDLVALPVREGRADETFIDATCEPAQTFSFGGVLAHVLTFSAVRRTLAIGALESAGITDLGAGDPMSFIGRVGDDAAVIHRRPEDVHDRRPESGDDGGVRE
jgi:AraC family transcriptional regulator